ncbi:MAG: universal stress protein [Deinococcus sp.]|nr:universal stress protein [Deinococcus sp.]
MHLTLLVPTDGSAGAIVAAKYAADLGARLGAAITRALFVRDTRLWESLYLTHPGELAPEFDLAIEVQRVLGEQARDVLMQLQRLLPNVVTVVSTGLPAEVICRYAGGADVIVMGRYGRRPWVRGGVGSTTDEVIRRAAHPVLLTPEHFQKVTRVVVAVNGSPSAQTALHLASIWAAAGGWPLWVLAWGTEEEQAHLAAEVRAWIQRTSITVQVSSGPQPPVLWEAVDGTDLVVVGTDEPGPMPAMTLGRLAEAAVRQTECPVLLTRA